MVKKALLVHHDVFIDKSFSPLLAAPSDVERLLNLLQQEYVGFAPENVVELENPNLSDFRMAVSAFFRDAEPDDYLFFYYAGHGIRSQNGELHLALKRTTMNNYEALSLDAGFIRRALGGSLAERKVVVLDCCHAGAFHENGQFVARAALEDDGLINASFEPEGTGTYVLGASQSGSSAFETIGADGKPYSLFTRAFIDGVETGEAAPGRETINLADISKYIYSQRNRSGKATRPYIDVENAMGLLEFARNPKSVEGVRAVAVPTAKPIPHVSPASNSLTAFLRGLRQYLVPLGSAVVLAMAGYFGYQYLYWPGYTLADPSRSGMTWTSSGDYPDNPGIVTVGCSTGGSSGEKCDPINGDAICSIALPLLCFSLVNGKKADWPGEADRKPARWSGGRVQLTAAMVPPAKLSDANRLCSDNFGSDYRVAEFHDSAWVDDSNISDIQNLRNHGWAFQAFGDINSEDRRFWVDVNDQPNGTCWNDRTLVE